MRLSGNYTASPLAVVLAQLMHHSKTDLMHTWVKYLTPSPELQHLLLISIEVV